MILTAHLGALIQRTCAQSKKHMQMHIGVSLTWTVCVNCCFLSDFAMPVRVKWIPTSTSATSTTSALKVAFQNIHSRLVQNLATEMNDIDIIWYHGKCWKAGIGDSTCKDVLKALCSSHHKSVAHQTQQPNCTEQHWPSKSNEQLSLG